MTSTFSSYSLKTRSALKEGTMHSAATTRRTLTLQLLSAAALTASAPLLRAQTTTSKVVVRISGLRNGNGKVQARLWQGKDGFLKDDSKAYRRTVVEISGGNATVTFADVPYGEYAVSAFHDENGNGKLDTRFPGIPTEGVAVSNDPHKKFGPPPYDACRFQLQEPEKTIAIVIEY